MKRIRSKATYAVLTCCMIAASVGAWGAVSGSRDVEPSPQSETQSVFNIPSQDVEADVIVTDVADPRETETETTEETTVVDEADNTPFTGNFAMPMASLYITKDYSGTAMVYSNTMNDWRIHSGIDFSDSRGQSVMAIQNGVVTDVSEDPLWGVSVTVDHGKGLSAKYCGLSKDSIPEVGCHVEKYAVIGTLGEIPIESKDGPHLHFEITVDGKNVDPLKAMNKK